ncbi:winged helix-turn-helix domain-containing protein [Streptomyces sp. S.PNR 29]|uniref:winged helix-turn-helix domain-containing protein n=1 Tax=Streptomyces sp. S.PNR 29 TaxID=2973805 RepID=UPI0025AFF221|nr:winged helix-turn-helix domain-containing protein [Streptomyces sp. S.PNR 29]MDN0194256.1 winged helix-turn-helix domain-containing protein [Streptomyces sp. S.PNR 29]
MTSDSAALNGQKTARPSHREVADVLRERIRSGELRPGQRMPTQARLSRDFGVERGTVRQALRILQSENLLTNVSKGSPATVADSRGALSGPAAPPRGALVALAPRVTAAFEARHVEISALCLMSTSLNLAMSEALRKIHEGELKPAKVDVRVLLPSSEIDPAFPAPVDPVAAGRLQRHQRSRRLAQAQVLEHNLLALRSTHQIDVSVTFRALPFTPPVKLYVFNGAEALFAYYTPTLREKQIGQEELEVYDVEGTRSMLFGFERDAGRRDTTFVDESCRWFESLWSTISTDLPLTD